jgi:hypothetical protein
MKDNVEQVQIDSVWTNSFDAKSRMEAILESENNFIQKTYPNMNELGSATPIRAELLDSNFGECTIRHMCKDESWIETEGVFCKRVPLDNFSLLRSKADNDCWDETELKQRESDYDEMEVLEEEARQAEIDDWYAQLDEPQYGTCCDEFGCTACW